MGTNEKLAQALGIDPIETVEVLSETPETLPALPEKPKVKNIEAQEDYELSRHVLRNLIQHGSTALEDVTMMARDQETPRAYEVMATLIKTVAETTTQLYDLQGKKKALDADVIQREADTINVEKAVFVGTTAELLKEIKAKKDGTTE